MKILILGTSNSILKNGWVFGFQQAFPEAEISNMSIGASPGIQFSTALATDFSKYDFVFLDSIPNDQNTIKFIGDISYFEEIIYQIMSTIASQTNLISLGFTLANRLRSNSNIYNHRKHISNILGQQFLDIKDILIKFGKKYNHQDKDLFEHSAHPDWRISQAIGFFLGRMLREKTFRFHRANGEFSAHFQTVNAGECTTSGEVIQRANRLISLDLLRLRAGQNVSLPCSELCVGMYINSKNSSGILEIKNKETSFYKEYYYNKTDGLQMKFVPFLNGAICNEIYMPETYTPLQRSPHTRFPIREKQAYTVMEISRLAFWNQSIVEKSTGLGDHDHLEISRTVGERILENDLLQKKSDENRSPPEEESDQHLTLRLLRDLGRRGLAALASTSKA